MNNVADLVSISKEARRMLLKMNHIANASHSGSALSIIDLLSVLYFQILKIDPSQPKEENRDRFILSKGHACSALYSILALRGFFPKEDLDTYSADGSSFLTHASHHIPGVEISTGSLGHALSISCGIALAAKKKNKTFKIITLLSDGELDEGSNWEALLFAPHHKLDNLTVIIDYNKIQSLGNVKDILDLEPLKDKFEAFGWTTLEIDGHCHKAIYETLSKLPNISNKPTAIIAHTIKGKGVDFMENQLLWHYKSPNNELYINAITQLK
jgi:transketolase